MTGGRETSAGADFTLIQALRGIAALWVVFFHMGAGGEIEPVKAALPSLLVEIVFDAGHFGVAIFFALSGFVIAHSLRAAEPSWEFLGRFALRRSLRLDPPYWASMALVVGFAWLSARVKVEPFTPPTLGAVAAHVAYLQVLLRVPPINVVYWTLTYEIQFYLFFAAMLVLGGKLARMNGAWGIMAVLAFLSAFGVFRWEGLFLTLWCAFFAGALGYRAASGRRFAAVFAVLVLVMAVTGSSFARISAATAVALALALATGRVRTALAWRPLQFLGAISYSLYLIHNPLIGATGYIAGELLGTGQGAAWVTMALMLAITVAGAWAFWRLLELPSHRWSRRVTLKRAGAGQETALGQPNR